MKEPSVMIVATCSDGHERLMYPEKCVIERQAMFGEDRDFPACDGETETYVSWSCPHCPINDYKYEVML